MSNKEQRDRESLDAAFAAINPNPPFLSVEHTKAKRIYRAYRKQNAKRMTRVNGTI